MSEKEKMIVFEANMDAAMRRHYRRTGAEMASLEMPFEDLLRAEDDGSGEDAGEYEFRQRAMGARALLTFVSQGTRGADWRAGGKPPHPADVLKQIYAVGRAMHNPYFASLTMDESGMMLGETKAAHSWRCKVLSGKIELTGMKGSRLPGQKSPESSASYAAAARGNTNRRAGKRRGQPAAKPRQGSFLRKLKTETT